MKVLHTFALMAVIGSALLIACSDDDNPAPVTPAQGGTAGSAGAAAGAAGSVAGAAGSTAGAAGSTAGAAGEGGAAGGGAGSGPDAGGCVKGDTCVTCCMAASPAAAVEIMGIAAQFECLGDAGACGTQCQATLCTPDAGMPDTTCTNCLTTDTGFVAAVSAGCTGTECPTALACLAGCM